MDGKYVTMGVKNFSKGGDVYAVSARPAVKYENGKRTDTVIGLSVTVVFPKNHFDTLVVTIADPVDRVSALIERDDGPVRVAFENFSARPYVADRQLKFTAHADRLIVLNDDVVDGFDGDFEVPELRT